MAEPKMQLEDWLDDLCVRFIINLPQEDLSSVARICFQVEEAQWFYEDFIRPLDPTLPSMSLRTFCLRIFRHCPLLAPFSVENHMRAFEEFLQYKTRVPVRGAILLNEAMDSTVLVKGWKKGANWSFPRGKINKDEDDLDCAVREVLEETGFDIREAGLVPRNDQIKYIEISMREQQIRLYVFRDVPMETNFQPRTRKEISKIQWYKLSELPAFRKKGNNQPNDAAAASNANKFYMVAPFLVPLKKWVVQQRKRDSTRAASSSHLSQHVLYEEQQQTEDDVGTQTDPTSGPPAAGGSSGIKSLEGATLELQRLLKVQPPTQGIQVSLSGPGSANHDNKGEALMAILQSKSSVQTPTIPHPPQQQQQQQQQQQPQPNTLRENGHLRGHLPFDPTHTQPPQPLAPHQPPSHYPIHNNHPPAQFLPPHLLPHHNTYHQPPPNFPIPSQATQNILPPYYNQPPDPAQYSSEHPGRLPNMPQYMASGNRPRKEPVLLHPQPLPPQVQQSRLTRGILPTPGLPDGAAAAGKEDSGHAAMDENCLRNSPRLAQQQRKVSNPAGAAAPQPTNHSMSLLSALKGGGTHNLESKRAAPPVPPHGAAATNQHGHYQSATWANVPSPRERQPMGSLPSPKSNQAAWSLDGAAQSMISQTAAGASAKPPPPTDKHRSALLEMFKKQGSSPPVNNEANAGSRNAPVELPAPTDVEAKWSPRLPTSVEGAAAAGGSARPNGSPTVMNPELNLPYRAFQILSRPAQGDKKAGKSTRFSPAGSADAVAGSRRGSHHMSPHGLPSPKNISRHVPRPENSHAETAGSGGLPPRVPSNAYADGHSQYQTAPGLLHLQHQQPAHQQHHGGPAAFSAAGMLQNRRESNPEQKQRLLSLFGRTQQSPTAASASASDRDKGKEPNVLDHLVSGRPRSRVASLASATTAATAGGVGGDPAQGSAAQSRRGSQTPISPADRDFLLGYLQAVSD